METTYIKYGSINNDVYRPGSYRFKTIGTTREIGPRGNHGHIKTRVVSRADKIFAGGYANGSNRGTQYFKVPRSRPVPKKILQQIPRSGSIPRIIESYGDTDVPYEDPSFSPNIVNGDIMSVPPAATQTMSSKQETSNDKEDKSMIAKAISAVEDRLAQMFNNITGTNAVSPDFLPLDVIDFTESGKLTDESVKLLSKSASLQSNASSEGLSVGEYVNSVNSSGRTSRASSMVLSPDDIVVPSRGMIPSSSMSNDSFYSLDSFESSSEQSASNWRNVYAEARKILNENDDLSLTSETVELIKRRRSSTSTTLSPSSSTSSSLSSIITPYSLNSADREYLEPFRREGLAAIDPSEFLMDDPITQSSEEPSLRSSRRVSVSDEISILTSRKRNRRTQAELLLEAADNGIHSPPSDIEEQKETLLKLRKRRRIPLKKMGG